MKETNHKDITNSRENKKLCKEGKVILIIILDISCGYFHNHIGVNTEY